MQDFYHYTSPIHFSLAKFDTHDLHEQERASLLNRIDDKYVIDVNMLPEVLDAINDTYSLLQIEQDKIFEYDTMYYDTDDYALYHMHHSGKKNRFKIRTRRYVETNTLFYELKIKNNKGLTNKIRKESNSLNNKIEFDSYFLGSELNIKFNDYKPKVSVQYQRITLLNKKHQQRVTIDLNILFKNLDSGFTQSLDSLAIIEIKRNKLDRDSKHSAIHNILKKLGYRTTTFSKYCMGCALTRINGLKYNEFKPNLLSISQAIYHSSQTRNDND